MKRLRRLNGQQITYKIFPKEDGGNKIVEMPIKFTIQFQTYLIFS